MAAASVVKHTDRSADSYDEGRSVVRRRNCGVRRSIVYMPSGERDLLSHRLVVTLLAGDTQPKGRQGSVRGDDRLPRSPARKDYAIVAWVDPTSFSRIRE